MNFDFGVSFSDLLPRKYHFLYFMFVPHVNLLLGKYLLMLISRDILAVLLIIS